MTLGELAEEVEHLLRTYNPDTPVRLFEFSLSGEPNYLNAEAVEYSTNNDSIVIW